MDLYTHRRIKNEKKQQNLIHLLFSSVPAC